MDLALQENIMCITGFTMGSLPFKYLGVPLCSKKLTVNLCTPLIERITSRLNHLSTKLLSYVGKIQLIRCVLFSIISYWMQVFPIPKKVLHHLESNCRNILWNGKDENCKKAPVAWDHLCDPKQAGGLNLTSLEEWNKANMTKLLWNLASKIDKLWVKWIHTYYLKGADIFNFHLSPSCSWTLRVIIKCRTEIM
ncbi:PREDICTED: uncharacterized protein LOC109326751 [Lupinus angustifolius]|uniref:uncharacterized protein LOC109326751 n=1 Tax=Lupinus angustifolius TaxID=3871 RepID=UPI00092F050D|nr:PREDICTED: uncharacterized protein LOC109326751 [Lupinus angustifolius]